MRGEGLGAVNQYTIPYGFIPELLKADFCKFQNDQGTRSIRPIAIIRIIRKVKRQAIGGNAKVQVNLHFLKFRLYFSIPLGDHSRVAGKLFGKSVN